MKIFVIDLGCTALLAGLCFWCMRKWDRIRQIMGVSCFLVAGCFLDRLCSLVMEGITQENAWEQMRLVGLGLSKSMAGAFLVMLCAMPGESAGNGDMEPGRKISYVEKLAVAGTAFFWCLLTVTGVFLGRGIWFEQGKVPRPGRILAADFLWTLLLFLTLLCFWLSVYRHIRAERGRQEEQKRQEERRQAQTYLYTVESNYQRTRELWHDLRNHISLLHLLLQEEKYEQMRDYLNVFGEEVDRIALPVKSGNLIADAVLADKSARAKRENIALELELCDLTGLPLKPDEICSLFGNLLDNATEECLRVSGERKILITCRMRERDFYFSVRNTLAEKGTPQETPLASRKSDRENVVGHGLGLRSVERVVNRYGGEFVTETGDGMFTAAVWLPGGSRNNG
ncbi:MAG: GHKL domain-containing protein [Lachnospiraceae bacterium]|nr:GHKL domain-containing protein [Butyrivibrio sp.]MCM1343084.1 GHKL domain-containing protein [Muribaculaceae bacterium]MCM1410405.1 GHKL domain-containing protein [Lachnospiraceae bacterium]